jgi:hypothetical protein
LTGVASLPKQSNNASLEVLDDLRFHRLCLMSESPADKFSRACRLVRYVQIRHLYTPLGTFPAQQHLSSLVASTPEANPDHGTESLNPKSVQRKLVDAIDGAINSVATEHILCTQCQKSIDTSRLLHNPCRGSEDFRRYSDCEALKASSSAACCHLCSLFLGKIQQQQPTTGPINVTLQISRSGGMTLLIQAGETVSQRIGDLAIVPVNDMENPATCTSASAKFTFPSQSSYENARVAKSLASEASFSLAWEWLQQCLQKHHKCMEATRAAWTTNGPTRLIDVGGDDGVKPRVVITQELGDRGLEYLTLSHCWGGADILRLLVENIDSLTAEIPTSTLPKTFQDAIVITRRLGCVPHPSCPRAVILRST